MSVKIQPHEGNRAGFLTQLLRSLAWRPAVILPVPNFNTQKLAGPVRLETHPSISSGRMRKHSHSVRGLDSHQHFVRGQTFAEKRDVSPHQNVHAVGGIAVLDAGNDEDVGGTRSSAGFSILEKTRG
jgi:hypothetical protein